MKELKQQVVSLIDILAAEKILIFSLLDQHLPITQTIIQFLSNFCSEIGNFISSLSLYLDCLQKQKLKNESLIEVIQIMKQKEETDLREWQLRAQILNHSKREDYESHKIPELFQALDENLEYYQKIYLRFQQLLEVADKQQNKVKLQSHQTQSSMSHSYQSTTKKQKSIEKYAKEYDSTANMDNSSPSTQRKIGAIRRNSQNTDKKISPFNPNPKQYQSVNPKYQSSSKERQLKYKALLQGQMNSNLFQNKKPQIFEGKHRYRYYFQESSIKNPQNQPRPNPHKKQQRKVRKYQYIFSDEEQDQNRDINLKFDYKKQMKNRDNHTYKYNTLQPFQTYQESIGNNNVEKNNWLGEFERNLKNEDSLQVMDNKNDKLGMELDKVKYFSDSSSDLEKMLTDSLLSSKKWQLYEMKQENFEDSDPDSLDQFHQTAQFPNHQGQQNISQQKLPRNNISFG